MEGGCDPFGSAAALFRKFVFDRLDRDGAVLCAQRFFYNRCVDRFQIKGQLLLAIFETAGPADIPALLSLSRPAFLCIACFLAGPALLPGAPVMVLAVYGQLVVCDGGVAYGKGVASFLVVGHRRTVLYFLAGGGMGMQYKGVDPALHRSVLF